MEFERTSALIVKQFTGPGLSVLILILILILKVFLERVFLFFFSLIKNKRGWFKHLKKLIIVDNRVFPYILHCVVSLSQLASGCGV